MRSLLARLDRLSWIAIGAGLFVGLAWVLVLPLGIALSGIVGLFSLIVLGIRGRWLEVGLLLTGIGLVPLLAYRWFGAPPVDSLGENELSMELMAPGAAYVFFVLGLAVTVISGLLLRRRSS
ncbi:MAG TPA: hypothetical protein VJ975_06845 [Candidatus Limnocylindria bacterium]|nr:hypothetical protein [Candidatus Limnocylindria bacterium]